MSIAYFVAIPSHERAELVAKSTLPMLIDTGGVGAEVINVFVAPDQHQQYQTMLDHEGWLARGVRVVLGEQTILGQRNAISRSYPKGAQVVCVDDDILGLKQRITPTETAPIAAHQVFSMGFDLLAHHGLTLWGVYPVDNPYFMRTGYTTDLRFICGGVHGMLNDPTEQLTISPKEDYERTLRRYQRDGGVIRLNDTTFTHGGYKRVRGGLQATQERTDITNRAAVAKLQAGWPGLVQLNSKRQGEVLLRGPRRKGSPFR